VPQTLPALIPPVARNFFDSTSVVLNDRGPKAIKIKKNYSIKKRKEGQRGDNKSSEDEFDEKFLSPNGDDVQMRKEIINFFAHQLISRAEPNFLPFKSN
jgi:hypothetical protein